MSTNKKNKVKFDLKNVHIALLTKNEDGTYTYDTPVALPGAVNLSLEAQGDSSPFYADGIVYYRTVVNNGYSGDLEIAMVTDWFRENVLKEVKDKNGVLVEHSENSDPVYFALLFQFDGDVKAIRHVMYNCTVSGRPTLESSTKEDTVEPGTETLSISADPREDGLVKAKTGDNTSDEVYQNWFKSVYVPDTSSSSSDSGSTSDSGNTSGSETTKYTVTFYNYDGTTVLGTESVESGGTATASDITDPTRESDGSNTYTFAGWTTEKDGTEAEDAALTNVTADRSVYAVFTATAVTAKYTVTFYNYDGTTELGTESVESGGTATATGITTPTRDSDETNDYTFAGWTTTKDGTSVEDTALTNVTADRSVYAVFTSSEKASG